MQGSPCGTQAKPSRAASAMIAAPPQGAGSNARAALLAELHTHTANWTPPAGFVRHRLDADGLVGKTPFLGPVLGGQLPHRRRTEALEPEPANSSCARPHRTQRALQPDPRRCACRQHSHSAATGLASSISTIAPGAGMRSTWPLPACAARGANRLRWPEGALPDRRPSTPRATHRHTETARSVPAGARAHARQLVRNAARGGRGAVLEAGSSWHDIRAEPWQPSAADPQLVGRDP